MRLTPAQVGMTLLLGGFVARLSTGELKADIRRGREWVPAVIRHNVVPTRMLLEVCNLGNTKDRELIKTKKYRQQLAEAIYQGLVDFYGRTEEKTRPAVVASGSK